MNRDTPLEDQVSAWLAEESPGRIPERFVRTIVEDTRGVGQERGLFGWRLGTAILAGGPEGRRPAVSRAGAHASLPQRATASG